MPPRRLYHVALGANLPSSYGTPEKTLRYAVEHLREYKCHMVALSRFFTTPAFPAGNGPDYVNAAAAIEGPPEPAAMMGVLHGIEAHLGRARSQRWGQRVIDLDLLTAGDDVHPDAETHAAWRALPLAAQMTQTPGDLILPHPRLQDRAFVLVPLAEVAPDWRHPILGKTVQEMRDALPASDLEAVTPLP
ncbi:MAG: 2-amino-4-hydroxy-6-hydroxymethyldihydropteridine diphosphokinase [Pseudomonadota bacterium]